MANLVFDAGREGFADGSVSWATPAIKVALVRGYTYGAAHRYMSDVTGGGGGTVVATSAALASKTNTSGIQNAANITFTAVPTGAACQTLIIYQSSAVTGGADVAAGSQRLIAMIDTATGLPVTPNSGDIQIAWDTSAATKIFKL